MADDLYARPELYDLVSPLDPDMERFYVEAAGGSGRQVLELACGTGRLTLPLLRSGADVTGGDLSQAMLDTARQQASMEGWRRRCWNWTCAISRWGDALTRLSWRPILCCILPRPRTSWLSLPARQGI